ncbi:glycosyltransferase family 4 protein [Prosthecomicrobium pneumaticum]|uniref:Colanic acid biosynthesis glycosyl transferase WcaI n=1 Tax=Prosthecomicrobium pneumaticum TaxID=81895 RepID=A0A7W9FKG6_9HYPH|nr:glycosyltransferase family 4 protein [Prosthecomicrobium pneumaticum]MBB5752651.1 colanic acid biosynthesis glycosyl transferase WcaI [Prosthecomicrobium pneumaticum]
MEPEPVRPPPGPVGTAPAACPVLMLAPYYWPEAIGSAPYCTDLAGVLAARGHPVRVLALRPHYPDPAPFVAWADGSRDVEWRDGVAIRRVPTPGRAGGGAAARLRKDLRYAAAVASMALRPPRPMPQAILVFVPSALALAAAAFVKWRTGARLIAVVHDVESGLAAATGLMRQPVLLALLRAVERFGLAAADRRVVPTQPMAAALRRLGCRGAIDILPLWARSAPPAPLPPLDRPVLGYGGSFGAKHGLETLVPLARALALRLPAARLVLRGEGAERRRLGAAFAGLGNVAFEDLVPAGRLAAALQAAHLHLVPQAPGVADYALPSKALSIMAAGRAFIAVAPPGSPLAHLAERSGGGVAVPPGDPAALVAVVEALLADSARLEAMGRAGRAHIGAHMEAALVLPRYAELVL